MGVGAFIARKLLQWSGWNVNVALPEYDKCVICVAPHTSNWDFIICELAYLSIGRRAGFLMKKDWFFFPLGYFFRAIGGVPVDRNRRTDLVEQIAEQFAQQKKMTIAITPEATRKANAEWKTGFYRIAQRSNVPIVLAYLDYDKKEVGIERTLDITGDIDADMLEMKQYYSHFNAKYKDKFVTGLE